MNKISATIVCKLRDHNSIVPLYHLRLSPFFLSETASRLDERVEQRLF